MPVSPSATASSSSSSGRRAAASPRLLRLIAGLEDVSGGEIIIDGVDAPTLPPSKRGLSMVFQSYALYPHMSVRNNIAFGLKMAGHAQGRDRRQGGQGGGNASISPTISTASRAQLSGGQRQRVAIGRAIVRQPKAFLFDEPLSNLDAALRVNMRIEIMQLHQSLGATMIYVTHDQVEAMTMADRIVVLNKGNIEQVGLAARTLQQAGFAVRRRLHRLAQDEHHRRATPIGVRPEHIALSDKSGEWEGTVMLAEHLGSDTFLHVDAGKRGTLDGAGLRRISGRARRPASG